jgi:hypothetical protein
MNILDVQQGIEQPVKNQLDARFLLDRLEERIHKAGFSDYAQSWHVVYPITVALFQWLILFVDMISNTRQRHPALLNPAICLHQKGDGARSHNANKLIQSAFRLLNNDKLNHVKEVTFTPRPNRADYPIEIEATVVIDGRASHLYFGSGFQNNDVDTLLSRAMLARIAAYGLWITSGRCCDSRCKGFSRKAFGGGTVVKFARSADAWQAVNELYRQPEPRNKFSEFEKERWFR